MRRLRTKIVCLCSILILAVSFLMPMQAFAESEMAFFVDTESGHLGEEVTVGVKVTGNTGVASVNLSVTYDESVLTLVKVEDAGLLGGALHADQKKSPYLLSWINDTATSNNAQSGELVKLTFKIAEDASLKANYRLELAVLTNGAIDVSGNDVECKAISGSIYVAEKACEHEWGDWERLSNRKHERICLNEDCGETESAPHNFDGGVVTKHATCTQEGEMTYTCVDCGAEVTETIEMVDHTPGAAATCTSDQKCTVCGNVIANKLEHNYTSKVTAPTCVKEGYTTYQCTRCSHNYKGETKPAKGHSFGAWKQTKEPTCIAAGEEKRTCSCGHYETKTIAVLNHNYIAKVTVPTCEKGGYTTHTCSRCGNSRTDSQTAAKGHSFGSWKVTTAAACEKAGVETRTCSVCNKSETKPIASLGHNCTATVTAPTCEKGGYTTYQCTRCSYNYKGETKPAKGHSFGAWKQTKEPTCIAAGEEKRTCSCGHYETKTIAALNHNYIAKVTAPTCEKGGYTTHTCSRCGDSKTDSQTAAKGHSYGAWKQTKAPTCTAEGQEKRTCSSCGVAETRKIAKISHTESAWIIDKEATFEQDGSKHTECTVCHMVMKTETISKKEHTPSGWITEKNPTCIEAGSRYKKCTVCGERVAEESIPALGHNCTATVTAPTCEKGGYTTYQCTRCSYNYKGETKPAKGHSFGAWKQTKAPTCIAAGEEKRTCSCGHSETKTIAALNHNYIAKVTAPTCEKGGYTTHTCSSCGNSRTDSQTAAKGHSFGSWKVTTAATCNKTGVETRICSSCNQSETRDIPKTQHSYMLEVTPPTETDKGYTTHTCTICGHNFKDNYTNPIGPTQPSVPDKITSNVMTVTGTTISDVAHSTSVSAFLDDINEGAYCRIYKNGQEVASTALVGTGMVLKLMDGNTVKQELVIVVYGDINGDGERGVTDMLQIKMHILKKVSLTGAKAQAGDLNGKNGITMTDFLQAKRFLLDQDKSKTVSEQVDQTSRSAAKPIEINLISTTNEGEINETYSDLTVTPVDFGNACLALVGICIPCIGIDDGASDRSRK